MLHQNKLGTAHLPEVVDLAVVATGLGVLQSSFGFVKQTGSFWDSTYWDVAPRPFLDCDALAYANAVAAWVRGEKDPIWANELPVEVKRPMRKSLKYLFKTQDTFLNCSDNTRLSGRSQEQWIELASDPSVSTQIVALRQLEIDEQLTDRHEALLLNALRSPHPPVMLHAITGVQDLKLDRAPIAEELRFLVESRDDQTRAKAIIALARLAQLDEPTIETAGKMIDSPVRYVVFAGLSALSSLDTVPDAALRAAERRFVRALQTCDYEFVGHFAGALNRWLEDPQSHVERLLSGDQPEYVKIATEAIQEAQSQSVALS